MSRRRGMYVSAMVCTMSLVGVSLVGALSAQADTPSTAAPASTATQAGSGKVPAAVEAAVSSAPTDVLVSYSAPAATRELQAAQNGSPQVKAAAAASAVRSMSTVKTQALAHVGAGVRVAQDFSHLPVQIVRVDSPAALTALTADPAVTSVSATQVRHFDAVTPWQSLTSQPAATARGYDGRGVRVAVLDTGIIANTAAAMAVFGDCSKGWATRNCRIDSFTDTGGSGQQSVHPHGTNVAGVVATMAPAAHLDIYNVFSSAAGASDSAILSGINKVLATAASRQVKAVNLSLDDDSHYTSVCSSSVYASAFGSLRAAGIVPVVAAGNSAHPNGAAYTAGLSDPACAPGALSVGAVYPANLGSQNFGDCIDATTRPDLVTCFSQSAPFLSILAPGVNVTAAGVNMSGTSQATPMVSGAVADLASANPNASADQLQNALTSSGDPVTDPRTSQVTPRLDVNAAATAFGSAPAAVTSVGSQLRTNAQITERTQLTSPNGEHALSFNLLRFNQGLVLGGQSCDPVVLAQTTGRPSNTLVMQSDGNLVLYANGVPAWATGTNGNPGAWAALQDDRNFVVYSAANKPLWATNTLCTTSSSVDFGTGAVRNRTLGAGQFMLSVDRRFKLVMQGDGNLVLYSPSRATWSSGSYGNPGAFAVLQSDNNLVVYSAAGRPLWSSGTSTAPTVWTAYPTKLVLQGDGNMVLYRTTDSGALASAVWATGTYGKL